jgi:hypothetical protein
MPVFINNAADSIFFDLVRDASARPRTQIERSDVFGFLESRRLVYSGDAIAFRYQADCLAGAGGWKYERLFGERFFTGQPYMFIEFKQLSGPFRHAGFLIEIFDRGELSLDVLEDDQAATIREAAAKLLDEVDEIAPHPETSPLVRWERAVQYLFLSKNIELAARPEVNSAESPYNPSWTLGAVLDHCPGDVRRVARVTGFYRDEQDGGVRNLPILWHFMIGHDGRLLSEPFEQAAECVNAPGAEIIVPGDNFLEILLPLLYVWAAIGEEPGAPALLVQPLPVPVSGRAVIERASRGDDSGVLFVSDQSN